MLRVALIALTCSAAPAAPPPYNDAQQGTIEEARALIAAMKINDDALRSMVWTQRTERKDADGWTKVEQSRNAFEPPRWSTDCTTWLPMEGEVEPTVTTIAYRFDGNALHTLHLETNMGVVREARYADLAMWPTPLKFMGRYLDPETGKTLPELLSEASDLRVRDGDSAGSRVVSGFVVSSHHAWFLEARVDPAHGFAPTRVTLYDGLIRQAADAIEVTRLEPHDNCWIPVEGVETVYYLDAETMSGEQWDRYAKGIEAITPPGERPDPSSPLIREAVKRLIGEVYGEAGIPASELAPPHRLTVTSIDRVNAQLPVSEFQLDIPKGAVIVDGLRVHASNGTQVLISR